jgi:hypothetical protein
VESDRFDELIIPTLDVTDLTLANGTTLANGAYTLYSAVMAIAFGSTMMNIVGTYGEKTVRTPWMPFFGIQSERCA